MEMFLEITIYTDGGCSGNPGPGAWAYVILNGTEEIKRSGSSKQTTNNIMELTAVISSLKEISKKKDSKDKNIILHTDSQYVKNGITSWVKNWEKNGWRTANKTPVKNKEYWIALRELDLELNVKWKWVKGHSGDKWNEVCDSLVQEEMSSLK